MRGLAAKVAVDAAIAPGMPDRTEAQFHTQRVMTWSVQSGAGKTSVMAIGFDHMGAGDVDCSKGKPAEKK